MTPIASAFAAFRSGEGLKGQLLRGGVGSIIIKIGSAGLNVLLAIVLARALGADGFGIYSFVFALITILAIPAQMGLPNLVVRETARAHAAGDWALIKGLWRWSSHMALMMSVALMAIGALAAWILAPHLPQGGLMLFCWGLILIPLIALGNLRGAALRGLRHVVQGQLPELILRPAFLITFVLGTYLAVSSQALTPYSAMMLHAMASLAAFVIGAWLLLRAQPQELRVQVGSSAIPSVWLRSAIPVGLVEGMQMFNGNIGLVVLGLFSSSEEVGLFRVALQGATLVTFALVAINLVVTPHFARLYAERNMAKLQRLAVASSRAGLLLSLPVIALLFLFGAPILSLLFGSKFETAYPALVILVSGQLIYAITGPASFLLYMTGHERDVVRSVGTAVAVNLLALGIFVPAFGVEGAAGASLVTFLVWNVMLAAYVVRRLGFNGTALALSRRPVA